MSEKNVNILIVDDHPIVREGLKNLIQEEPNWVVCGEAEDALTAMQNISKSKPQLIIIDLSLKSGNGLELIKNIKAFYPELIILVISMHNEAIYAERAIRAGARGYIMKAEAADKLIMALKKVLVKEIYLSDGLRNRILEKLIGNSNKTIKSPIEILSDRELQVFQLLAEGNNTSHIAEKLNISVSTIDTHYAHIKKKLDIKSNNELISYAVNWNLSSNVI